MRKSKLFSIEIDVSDQTYESDTGRWYGYGTIVAEGNTIEELLEDASVDIVDQDGGNPRCSPLPADESWMQELIEKEYAELLLPRGIVG